MNGSHPVVGRRVAALVVTGSFILAGCAVDFPSPAPRPFVPTPGPSPLPIRPGELALVTHAPFDPAPGIPVACAGVGLDATLHGDPADPNIAWLINRRSDLVGDARLEVAWPPGYRARFTPNLEVLDGTGRVRLREGDHIDGSCGTDVGGAVILELSFPWAT